MERRSAGTARRLVGALLLAWAMLTGTPAMAAGCGAFAAYTASFKLASVSPTALTTAGGVPALAVRAGFTCPPALLSLGTRASIKGTMTSDNKFVLRGPIDIGYVASADANGATPFKAGTSVDYGQSSLLTLLGLGSGDTVDLPFYIRPAKLATRPPPGTYKDRITIDWTWSICSGFSLCVGGPSDSSTGQPVTATRSAVDVELVVTAKDITMSLTQSVTWDPVNKGQNPRALPGSRRRLSVAVTNPDTVALDAGSLAVVLPTPPNLIPALDGDGTTGGTAAIVFTEGSPASSVVVRYGGPADTTDDVEFSSDGGQHWDFQPAVGDLASEGLVTQIRVRPKGAMTGNSSFSVSATYLSR